MNLYKVSINNIEKWLKNGVIPDLENNVYVISTTDHCRAIENMKKSGVIPNNFSNFCDNICNNVICIDLTKKELVDALYDEEFYKNHFSKNQNGLSLASYISLYFQNYYPEERDSFVEDIDF